MGRITSILKTYAKNYHKNEEDLIGELKICETLNTGKLFIISGGFFVLLFKHKGNKWQNEATDLKKIRLLLHDKQV